MLNRIGKAFTLPAVFNGHLRAAFDRLRHVLDTHGKMKTIQYMEGWTDTGRLPERTRSVGTIAEDGRFLFYSSTKTLEGEDFQRRSGGSQKRYH